MIDSSGDGRLSVRSADLKLARPPRWLWQDRLARGYLNLIIGNEGVGKGTLFSWIAAQTTRGKLPGDLHSRPIGVAILGDEDGFDDVWTPRLHAAGADLARVVQIARPDGGFVNLREDREKLVLAVKEHDLGLLFFDQLLDNLGVGVDDWRQKPVRDALQPLRSLAAELDIAALGSLHPNKRATTFRQLISGTVAFNSVSRSSLLLAQHPEDEDRRVLVRGKGNLSAEPPAVDFALESHSFDANDHTFRVPVARDFRDGDVSIDELLDDQQQDQPRERSKIAEACEMIEALLPRDGEWHLARPIKEACAREGIDERTCGRAKQRLGLDDRRTHEFQAQSQWRWPHRTTLGTREEAVLSVLSVQSGEGPNPLRSSSQDTLDTPDTSRACPECAPEWPTTENTAPCSCKSGPADLIDGRCSRCFGGAS